MLTLAAMALTLVVQGQDFRWSAPLAEGRRLTIKNIVGDITVEPASGRTAEVTAVKRAGRRGDPEDVEIRQIETGEGIEICVIYSSMGQGDTCEWRGGREGRGRHDRREENDTRVHFTIRAPAGIRLRAATVSGDVFASGLRADVDLSSVSGEVRLRDVTARMVEAQSVSGDIELIDVHADEVGAQTVSGDVDFSGEIRRGGDYDFQTLSGDVVLRVPRGIGAEVTASTFSGDFETSFPFTSTGVQRESKWARRQRINGTIGGGGATIRLQSFSGDVEILERGGR